MIRWNDGNTTVVPFAAVADGPAVHFTGYVAYSHTWGAATYTTNEPSTPINDSVEAPLAFACPAGASSAAVTGLLGVGSPF